jgi:hypothetical protein
VVIPVGGQDEASIQSKDSGGEKEEEKAERRSSRYIILDKEYNFSVNQ